MQKEEHPFKAGLLQTLDLRLLTLDLSLSTLDLGRWTL